MPFATLQWKSSQELEVKMQTDVPILTFGIVVGPCRSDPAFLAAWLCPSHSHAS